MAQATTDARERLLQAWRGEIEAKRVYEELARRERDPRRSEILSRMGEAEAKHRERLENHMRSLGIAIPDPATVTLGPWHRLQLRFAPTEVVLKAQEAAENDEVTDRYLRPTGDAPTDQLLAEIREEEHGHRSTLRAMEAGGGKSASSASPAMNGPSARLDRILGRESWHQTGSSWISGAIYGANDGLAAVFGIVAGVSGATGANGRFVLTAGLAGALASALSMATGAFLAERSENEVAAANIARERQEISDEPEEEKEELSLYYQLKGLSAEEADELVEKLARDPESMLRMMAAEELGGADASGGSPTQAAIAAGISTAVGAIIPVLPFFWLSGTTGVLAAAAVSLIAHFLVGAAKSLVTLRTWWSAGLEMTVAGVIVGVATYAAGVLFKFT